LTDGNPAPPSGTQTSRRHRHEVQEKIKKKQAEADKLEGTEVEEEDDEDEDEDGKANLKVHNPDEGAEADKGKAEVKYLYELWFDEQCAECTNQANLFKKLKDLLDSVTLEPGKETQYMIVVQALDPAK
jgi:hypothetical protein